MHEAAECPDPSRSVGGATARNSSSTSGSGVGGASTARTTSSGAASSTESRGGGGPAAGASGEGVAGTAGATGAVFLALAPTNVSATTDLPVVQIRWTAPNGELPVGYVIERDGEVLAQVGAEVTSYDDPSSVIGIAAPTGLATTQGTLPGVVRLTWQAPPAATLAHAYGVRALYGTRTDQRSELSALAVGSATPPTITGYEFSRDNGVTWEVAGTSSSFDDTSPVRGVLVATSTARFDPSRGLVTVSVDKVPVLVQAPSSKYRVRASTSTGPSAPSEPSDGFAGVGPIIDYQWQRASSESGAEYWDLPGVTGSIWVDADVPLDVEWRYRAVMTSKGAFGISEPDLAKDVRAAASITAGGKHSCALLSDGSAVCWGDNSLGQAVGSPDRHQSISAGGAHTCAVRVNETIHCWGDNTKGQAPSAVNDHTYRLVSAGLEHSCAVTADQHVSCWGSNAHGQTNAPDGTFVSVAAGASHTCGIRTDGSISCWGDTIDPAQIPASGSFRMLASGDQHACAIDSAGDLVCWGSDNIGQAPARVSGPFQSVACGWGFTCGVLETGQIRCWGYNAESQAPSEPFAESYRTPALSDLFSSVAAGEKHGCGILRNGRVRCWGSNSNGQAPPLVPSGEFKQVVLGTGHSCAIRTDDHVSCFGNPIPEATPSPSAERFRTIASSFFHTCGVTVEGRAVCWGGYNLNGEEVPPAEDTFKSLATGYSHTCGLRSDGSIRCWGGDHEQEVSTVPAKRFGAVSAGEFHSCGILLEDGQITCWGSNQWDQAPVTVPNGPYVSLDSRGAHNCGLDTHGELYCWGATFDPFVTVPPSGPFEAVAVGEIHGCALRSVDQKIQCWGENSYGQAPESLSIDSFQSIATNSTHTCGVRTDGKVLCWGENENRQAPRPGQ